MTRTAAIVLAAGASTRLGEPKQLLMGEHGTLIEHVVACAAAACCDPIVVVTGAVRQPIRERMPSTVIVVDNDDWRGGMGSSIRAGSAAALAADDHLEHVVVLLCDQPRLSSSILMTLAERWKRSRLPMAACRYADTIGPPCGFDRSCFAALRALPDERGAKHLLWPTAQVCLIDWPDGAVDIDTPEDLRRWRAMNGD